MTWSNQKRLAGGDPLGRSSSLMPLISIYCCHGPGWCERAQEMPSAWTSLCPDRFLNILVHSNFWTNQLFSTRGVVIYYSCTGILLYLVRRVVTPGLVVLSDLSFGLCTSVDVQEQNPFILSVLDINWILKFSTKIGIVNNFDHTSRGLGRLGGRWRVLVVPMARGLHRVKRSSTWFEVALSDRLFARPVPTGVSQSSPHRTTCTAVRCGLCSGGFVFYAVRGSLSAVPWCGLRTATLKPVSILFCPVTRKGFTALLLWLLALHFEVSENPRHFLYIYCRKHSNCASKTKWSPMRCGPIPKSAVCRCGNDQSFSFVRSASRCGSRPAFPDTIPLCRATYLRCEFLANYRLFCAKWKGSRRKTSSKSNAKSEQNWTGKLEMQ